MDVVDLQYKDISVAESWPWIEGYGLSDEVQAQFPTLTALPRTSLEKYLAKGYTHLANVVGYPGRDVIIVGK